MTTLIVALGLLVGTLLGVGTLAHGRQLERKHRQVNTLLYDHEHDLRQANTLLYDQLHVLAQLGELVDHAGVYLEHGPHQQESADLKSLGSILRDLPMNRAFNLTSAQPILSDLGDRYGIEPLGGGPYDLRRAVRIAEEIFKRVLPPRQPG